MNILITGASGFIGQHLIQALLKDRKEPSQRIIATDCQSPPYSLLIPFYRVDLTNARSTEKIIRKIQPRQIYHLAGFSSAARSFQEPARAILQNLTITANVLQAVLRMGAPCRILLMSTVQVYGDARGKICEQTKTAPLSPYAMSKLAMEELARLYFRNFGLDIIIVRATNQIGPGQSDQYVTAGFARQIVEMKMGTRPLEMEVGNLQVKRDFLDVRDAVQAYLLLMRKAESGEIYNLASGKNILVAKLLHKMLLLSRLDPGKIKISVSRARFRPEPKTDQSISIAKIQKLGFKPKIPLQKTLKDLTDSLMETFPKAKIL